MLDRITSESTTYEEAPTRKRPSLTNKIGRVDKTHRYYDLAKVVDYNILEKKVGLREWKSYSGLSIIIDRAREIMQTE